jgi:hypothetical protein
VRISSPLIGLLAAGLLTACSSGSKGADPYCQHLADVGQRLASAEQDLFQGGAREQSALSHIVGELQDVEKGAPADISKALAALATAFEQARGALQDRTAQGREQLAEIAHVLSTDGKKVSEYVTSKCT